MNEVRRKSSPSIASDEVTTVRVVAPETPYKFPKDTTASILTSGLLGEQYIGLDAGGDMNNLATGETLKLTQSAVVLEKLISQFLYSKAAEGDTAKK